MSSLDAAAAETGEPPEPDLVVAVQALDDVKVGGLAERILAAQRGPRPHQLRDAVATTNTGAVLRRNPVGGDDG